jgi:hypothetical protein
MPLLFRLRTDDGRAFVHSGMLAQYAQFAPCAHCAPSLRAAGRPDPRSNSVNEDAQILISNGAKRQRATGVDPACQSVEGVEQGHRERAIVAAGRVNDGHDARHTAYWPRHVSMPGRITLD